MRPLTTSSIAIVAIAFSSLSFAHHHCNLDFGSCSSPGIQYGYNIDGSQRYGYAPINGTYFPHGWSPDIATIESFICNRLESPCNAPAETVQRCREAFNLYSGLSEDNAVQSWNLALGLNSDGSDNDSEDDNDHECPSPPPVPASPNVGPSDYLTTTTTTLLVPATVIPYTAITYKTTTLTQTTLLLSIYTKTYTTDRYTSTIPSPASTLTLTLTLPIAPTVTDTQALSNTLTYTTTEVTTQTGSTDTTTSLAVAQTTSTNRGSNDNNNSNHDGGGSPFDPESVAVSQIISRTSIYYALGLGLVTLALAFAL